MLVVAPGSHPVADRVWRTKLKSKPNGARTLGLTQKKYLAPIFERAGYDMLITYAADMDIDIPEGVKKVAVCVHQNWPIVNAVRSWQKIKVKLELQRGLDVDYFCNEDFIIKNIQDLRGKVYYLPRFIDTSEYPEPRKDKPIETLWFTNRWGEWAAAFENYKQENELPRWISHGRLGLGEEILKDLDRAETLKIVNRAKKVWAVGICQLEAQYFGAEIVSLRGAPLDFYDQNTIQDYLEQLLHKI